MSKLTRIVFAGGAAAFALTTAACGSSSGSGLAVQSSAVSSAPPVSSASPATTASTAAKASTLPSTPRLAAIVIQPAEVPAGLTATPHEADADDASSEAAMVQCVGGRDTDPDKIAEADSPDFTQNGGSVSSSATSYKTQADVDADVAFINSPKINSCYAQLAKSQLAGSLPAGGTVDAVTFAITPGHGSGPANVAGIGTGTITATVSGQQVTIYLDMAFITGPLTEAEVDIENPSQPVPATLFTQLTTAVANRAAQS
jgi:hypothetical protein